MSVPTSLTLDSLPSGVRSYVDKWAEHCNPDGVHVCDGSDEEDKALLQLLVDKGSITPLSKLENWWGYRERAGRTRYNLLESPVVLPRQAIPLGLLYSTGFDSVNSGVGSL